MNLYVSLLRTGVPVAVGAVVAHTANIGLDLEGGAVSGVLTPCVTFAYYGLFRLAEKYASPRFGWLLGYAKPPAYDTQSSIS